VNIVDEFFGPLTLCLNIPQKKETRILESILEEASKIRVSLQYKTKDLSPNQLHSLFFASVIHLEVPNEIPAIGGNI